MCVPCVVCVFCVRGSAVRQNRNRIVLSCVYGERFKNKAPANQRQRVGEGANKNHWNDR